MKELPIAFLKGYSYVGTFVYRLCVPNAFGGIAGFDMDASHIFPQGVLAAITLIGGGAGAREPRASSGCEAGLPCCSMAITTLLGVGSDPTLLEQKL